MSPKGPKYKNKLEEPEMQVPRQQIHHPSVATVGCFILGPHTGSSGQGQTRLLNYICLLLYWRKDVHPV